MEITIKIKDITEDQILDLKQFLDDNSVNYEDLVISFFDWESGKYKEIKDEV